MPAEREIFDGLLRGRVENLTEELLLLGLYHYHKWDRIKQWEDEHPGREMDAATHLQIANSFTGLDIERYRQVARQSLQAEVAHVAARTLAADLRASVQRSWWDGFGQSLAAAIVYSLLLLALFLVVTHLGSDVAAVLGLG